MPRAVLFGLTVALLTTGGAFASRPVRDGEISYAVRYGTDHRVGVFGIDSDGAARRHILESVGTFAWSTNGSKLAFFGSGGVYIAPARARPQHLILKASCPSGDDVVWSRDGSMLAIACNGTLLVQSEVKGVARIIVVRVEDPHHPVVVVRSLGAQVGGLAWSPDNSSIAFYKTWIASKARGGGLIGELDAIRPDGSGRRHVAPVRDFSAGVYRPSWSPDGRIAFQRQQGFFAVLTPAGRTLWTGRGSQPVFSPDGRHLAFWRQRAGAFVTDARGRQTVRIPAGVYFPGVWAPAGDRLAFPGPCRTGIGLCVVIARTDGSHVQRLRAQPDMDQMYELAWRPG